MKSRAFSNEGQKQALARLQKDGVEDPGLDAIIKAIERAQMLAVAMEHGRGGAQIVDDQDDRAAEGGRKQRGCEGAGLCLSKPMPPPGRHGDAQGFCQIKPRCLHLRQGDEGFRQALSQRVIADKRQADQVHINRS